MEIDNSKNAKVILFEMIMDFEITLKLKESDGITRQPFILTQTIPFVPDDEYIHKTETIIENRYNTDEFEVLYCHFKGYEKFKLITIDINKLEQLPKKEFDIENERE